MFASIESIIIMEFVLFPIRFVLFVVFKLKKNLNKQKKT